MNFSYLLTLRVSEGNIWPGIGSSAHCDITKGTFPKLSFSAFNAVNWNERMSFSHLCGVQWQGGWSEKVSYVVREVFLRVKS